MKNLVYKEFRLALHPTALIFLALSALLLIPNYPYYVTFFYTALGIFFVCLTGRENHDIEYSAALPVRKRDLVSARFTLVIVLELLQMLIALPFAIIRSGFDMPGNQAGMDANIALFGLSFIMLGIFNLVFFLRYYRNPDKVGSSFAWSSSCMGVYMCLVEACTFFVPLFMELDTPDPVNLMPKLVVLGVGVVVFVAFTAIAWKRAACEFEALDL